MADDRVSRICSVYEKYGRPFYYYDGNVVAEQAALLFRHLPQFEFLYSIKANPFPPVVKAIFAKGIGADAASAKEVALAAAMDLPRSKVLYSAPGKTRDDIESALDASIIVADSVNELALIDRIAGERGKRVQVGVRINPDFTMFGDKGASGKFGVDAETLPGHSDLLRRLANIDIVGIHVHVRSQILDDALLLRYYDNIFRLARDCRENLGWKLEFINFGGGIGVPYSKLDDSPLDLPRLGDECASLVEKHKNRLGLRLIIESGRFLTCAAGFYVTPVVDIKESRGTKYLIVRNGLNGFLRPAIAELLQSVAGESLKGFSAEPLFTVKDAFRVSLAGKGDGPFEKVTVVGNLCTATDMVAAGIQLPKAEIGDLVVVSNAGSYAYPLSPIQFSSHSPPLQAFRDDDHLFVE